MLLGQCARAQWSCRALCQALLVVAVVYRACASSPFVASGGRNLLRVDDHDKAAGLRVVKTGMTQLFPSSPQEVHRIPALLAVEDDIVLAFSEQRLNTGDDNPDNGDINVVMRRSEDGGKSWSDSEPVCDFGTTHVCGNPAPVEDERGRIHLLVSVNPADSGELSGHVKRSVWQITSLDKGKTWQAPREISATVKPSEWQWYATGPGHGIRLQHQQDNARNGRLVVACDHSEQKSGALRYSSHIIYSDDHGDTWQLGLSAPEAQRDNSNEASVVELGNGTLVLSARNYVPGKPTPMSNRLLSASDDGGYSWAMQEQHPALYGSDCEGSIALMTRNSPVAVALLEGGKSEDDVLIVSHSTKVARRWPGGPWDRWNLRLSTSTDGGRTWPAESSFTLHEGLAGYSDMQVLRDGTVLVIHETGNEGMNFFRLVPRFS